MDLLSYLSFQPVLDDWCNKVVVCAILSVGWCIYIRKKNSFAANQKSSPCSSSSGFPLTIWGRSSQCSMTGFNKGHGMCYPVCGMVHIKEPLLLIGKSSLCDGSGFPSSLSEWSLTICLTPYNRK